jgi:hypothetical protein
MHPRLQQEDLVYITSPHTDHSILASKFYGPLHLAAGREPHQCMAYRIPCEPWNRSGLPLLLAAKRVGDVPYKPNYSQ